MEHKMPTETVLLFVAGGVLCAITSFLLASYLKKPAVVLKRIEYALISGFGSFAICWIAFRKFPDKFEAIDAIPYSIFIGLFGIGRVIDFIAKKYGLDKTNSEELKNDTQK